MPSRSQFRRDIGESNTLLNLLIHTATRQLLTIHE